MDMIKVEVINKEECRKLLVPKQEFFELLANGKNDKTIEFIGNYKAKLVIHNK